VGTTVRFALLAILLLVSSASMILDAITGLSGASDEDGLGRALAAGADPLHSSDIATLAHTVTESDQIRQFDHGPQVVRANYVFVSRLLAE
jgi:hypothetical protein